jgi:hypothetical protein
MLASHLAGTRESSPSRRELSHSRQPGSASNKNGDAQKPGYEELAADGSSDDSEDEALAKISGPAHAALKCVAQNKRQQARGHDSDDELTDDAGAFLEPSGTACCTLLCIHTWSDCLMRFAWHAWRLFSQEQCPKREQKAYEASERRML